MRARPAILSRCLKMLRARLREEHGHTLSEMITVLAILGVILAGLTAVFVSATRAEVDMNERFQAQQEARLALDKIRREGHCARALTPIPAANTFTNYVTLEFGSYCAEGATDVYSVTWCTSGSGSRRKLRRIPGSTIGCTGGTVVADYLTQANVFGYTPQSTTSLAKLRVRFTVDVDPADASAGYRLHDDIVLRNARRA